MASNTVMIASGAVAVILCLVGNVRAGYSVDGSNTTFPVNKDSLQPSQTCDGVFCPEESRCHGGQCICDPGLEGKGALGCFGGDVTPCIASSDVISQNLQEDRIEIPSTCQYELTNYRISSPSKKGATLKCLGAVYASNVRYMGKLFVGAFDLSFNVKPVDQEKAYYVQFRALGQVDPQSGEYVFQPRIRVMSTFPWFEPGEQPVDYDYTFEADADGRRLRFEFPICGFKLFFRPAHPLEGKDQTFLPGLVFVVDEDVGQVEWTQAEGTVCLAPPGDGVSTMEDIGLDQGIAGNPEMALAKMVFTEKKLYVDYLPQVCSTLSTEIGRCPDDDEDEALNRAVLDCTTILTTPVFVNCFSEHEKPGEPVQVTELFTECVRAFCSLDTAACESVQNRILTTCPDDHTGVVMATHSCTFD